MRKNERIWLNVVRGEIFLRRLTITAGIVLLLTQAALFKDDLRTYFSQVDYLEGQPIAVKEPAGNNAAIQNVVRTSDLLRKSQTITIHLIKPQYSKNTRVTVNGQAVGDFQTGYLEFSVYSGDYVEIDATELPEAGQFIVNTNPSGQLEKLNGLLLESQGNIVTLGKIKFTP